MRDVSLILKNLIPFAKEDGPPNLTLKLNANEEMTEKTRFCKEIREANEFEERFPLVVSVNLYKKNFNYFGYDFYFWQGSVYFEKDNVGEEDDYNNNRRRFNRWTKRANEEFEKILNSS